MSEEANPALQRAMQSVAAASAKAAADPARPSYHFRPPAQWMNDPNGVIYHAGWYHLFYQHNPYGDDWGHMHWGHARSRDLVVWEQLPIALWPSLERNEEHCFSGCAALTGQGQPILLYTSVHGTAENRLPNEQWAALGSPDWIGWQKHPANPILALASQGGPPFEGDWRDPFLFHEAGRTFLVLGGNFAETAAVALYEALDDTLSRWRYCGLLYQQPRQQAGFLECPNFVRLGERWILLTSPYRPVEYVTGRFDLATLSFTPEQSGVLDPGASTVPNYYATNILFAESGQCILLGWVRGFPAGRGWNGCLALPRILTLGADGRPRQHPIPGLAHLRQQAYTLRGFALDGSAPGLAGVQGDALELLLRVNGGGARQIVVQLRRSDDGERAVEIRYDGAHLTVAGTEVALTVGDEPLDLHLFLDKSVLEVFAQDGRVAVTRVIDAPPADQGVALVATGGAAHVDELQIWTMGSIW